jgi:hypothetical protein
MCHGNLNPKYLVREIEARVKHVSFQQDMTKPAVSAPQAGLRAWLRGAIAALLRKDRAYV